MFTQNHVMFNLALSGNNIHTNYERLFAMAMSTPADTKQKSNSGDKVNSNIKFSFYQKLIFLYFLNIVDWICTEALLSSGRFYEANPFMEPVLDGFWTTILIKCVLPLALVCACALVYKLSGGHDSVAVNVLLYIGIIAYVIVNLWHIFNFVLLFFTF